MKVGILTSHPIQYQAPWFRALAEQTDLQVFFAHRQTATEQAGFGVAFDWDVDLLSGYSHTFLSNVAARPTVNRFGGCDTPQIAVEIVDQAFDAFIVTGWYLKSYWQAVRACRRAQVPVLVRGDSQLDASPPLWQRALRRLTHRFALRQFDGFLSVGQRNRVYLRHYGVPDEKIFFAPHFVDNERFASQAGEMRNSKFELRKGWGIPEDAFCVLFCGKFMPEKRPLDLIKAAQLLVTKNATVLDRRYRGVHLLFVGAGELGPELRAHCNVLFDAEAASKPDNGQPITDNRKPAASFAGFLNQTEVSRAYVAADVLVLPSESETWGLTVNEAMACGLPAIVSDAVGCAPDLIEEGKTGFTFPVGDCEQLACRLGAIAQLKERGHDFNSALRSKVRDYSVEAAVEGTMVAIEAILRSKQKDDRAD